MFCRQCGNVISEGGKFCGICGTSAQATDDKMVSASSNPTSSEKAKKLMHRAKIIIIISDAIITVLSLLQLFVLFVFIHEIEEIVGHAPASGVGAAIAVLIVPIAATIISEVLALAINKKGLYILHLVISIFAILVVGPFVVAKPLILRWLFFAVFIFANSYVVHLVSKANKLK